MVRRAQKTTKLTRDVVVALAQKYLDRHQPRRYRLVARPDRIERTDGHWYVQVDPVPEGVSSADFTRRVVEAGMELQERERAPIELTNMLPRDIMEAEMLLPRLAQALSQPLARGAKEKKSA